MEFPSVIPTSLEEVRVDDHGDAFWPANLGNHWAIIVSPKYAIRSSYNTSSCLRFKSLTDLSGSGSQTNRKTQTKLNTNC